MQLRFTFPVIVLLALVPISCGVIAWRLIAPPSTVTLEYLLLDETGCLAAQRIGLPVTPLETAAACQVVSEVDMEFNWIVIGPNRINRTHVIAMQTPPEKGRP